MIFRPTKRFIIVTFCVFWKSEYLTFLLCITPFFEPWLCVFENDEVSVDGRLDVNVALNRPAYQVSTYTDDGHPGIYRARHANDGNSDTDMHIGTCAITNVATNPWWAVDLLVRLYVVGVMFTNRNSSGRPTSASAV